MFDALIAWDHHTFQLINGTWHHPLLDRLFPFLTDPTHFLLPLGIIALTLLLWGDGRMRQLVVLAVVGVVLADAVSAHLFKETVLRTRPCNALPQVRLLVGCANTPSFPSNHAVNASALALLVALYIRPLAIPAAFAALLVAYSRVYVGVHYPLDVLSGALLGVAIALLLSQGLPFVLRRLPPWAARTRVASALGAQGS
jgi:undecaprenyl-diphosphatase